MFGLKKLFSSNKPFEKQLATVLESYRSEVFPAGLAQACQVKDVSHKRSHLSLSLVLKFAALSEHDAIVSYLEKQLQCDVTLTLTVALPQSAVFKEVKHIILVASGKGGVGKSTTAVNLASALIAEGAKVGVLDADIYGPSIPILLGLEDATPEAKDDKHLLPMNKHGLKAQSIGFLVDKNDATVWRGPMASGALTQLLNETDWGELDYLIVDMPPGTGDIQLTMSQKVPASGAVIVTTPQNLALADAQKGIAMFNKVNMPILGLIENMSYFNCIECGAKNHVFGQCGGEKMAHHSGTPLLAQIPLDMDIRLQGEAGQLLHSLEPNTIATIYQNAAKLVASQLYYQNVRSEIEILITDD